MRYILILFIFFSVIANAYGFKGYVKTLNIQVNIKKVLSSDKGGIILFGDETKEIKNVFFTKKRVGLFNTKVVADEIPTGEFYSITVALEFDKRGKLIHNSTLLGDEMLLGSHSSKSYHLESIIRDGNNYFIIASQNKLVSLSSSSNSDLSSLIANTMYKREICFKIDNNLNKLNKKPLDFFTSKDTKWLLNSVNDGYIEILGGKDNLSFMKLDKNCNITKKPRGINFNKNNIFLLKDTLVANDNVIILGRLYANSHLELYLTKIDSKLENIFWVKKIKNIVGNNIIKTVDGYIIVGKIYKSNKDVDAVILKIDKDGNKIWQKTFGGKNFDEFKNIATTSDNGYIISGTTKSYGKGKKDIWILKINKSGKISWGRTFGGKGNDWTIDMTKTTDGGFIIAGKSDSFKDGEGGIYLIKIDKDGNFN